MSDLSVNYLSANTTRLIAEYFYTPKLVEIIASYANYSIVKNSELFNHFCKFVGVTVSHDQTSGITH